MTPTAPGFLAALLAGEDVVPADLRRKLQGWAGTDYPSVDDFGIVYRLAALGHDADTTLGVMLAFPGYGYFANLARKNNAAAVRWLYDAHAKADAYAKAHGSDVAAKYGPPYRPRRSLQPGRGRTGATDCAVFLAHRRLPIDAA